MINPTPSDVTGSKIILLLNLYNALVKSQKVNHARC